jgi:hypothetical protein
MQKVFENIKIIKLCTLPSKWHIWHFAVSLAEHRQTQLLPCLG